MIDLDVVAYDMFDLQPLSEYELYIKNFGSEDTRQVSYCLYEVCGFVTSCVVSMECLGYVVCGMGSVQRG